MSRKRTEGSKTYEIKKKRSNGDIYVYNREEKYNPETKRMDIIKEKLIGKILKGGDGTMVPTKPYRRKTGMPELPGDTGLKASRKHTGMMDILEHIGMDSGIDTDLYACTDPGTAQKILSVARYLVATHGDSLPHIKVWQLSHPIPYAEGLSEDIYHSLFERIGLDETLRQKFFKRRTARLAAASAVAYDSTTISTDSENQAEARRGYNKDGNGKDTIKLLTFYDIASGQPLAFSKQPGNIPDVAALSNALDQLDVLDAKQITLVTDNGFYSEANITEMLERHYKFTTKSDPHLTWIKSELGKHFDELVNFGSCCSPDGYTNGVTITLMKEFIHIRKNASNRKGLEKGAREKFKRRIYLHLYLDIRKKAQKDAALNASLRELKTQLEQGAPLEEMTKRAQALAGKYLSVKVRGKKVAVSFKDREIAEAKQLHGVIALVSNETKDTEECLTTYRRREHIEEYFKIEKRGTDGDTPRVWYADNLMGRMFAQFIALCYYEYLYKELARIKKELEEEISESKRDTHVNVSKEERLLKWMKAYSLYDTLTWFDAIEETNVSYKLKNQRWSTETTERDRLFLQRLGIKN